MALPPALDRVMPRVSPGTSPPRRFRTLALLLVLALTVAICIDTVAWFRLEQRLHRRLRSFADSAARTGLVLRYDTARRGGWPFSAALLLDNPRLEGAGARRGTGWSGELAELDLALLHPAILHMTLDGTQSLHLGPISLKLWSEDLAIAGDADRIMLTADALHVARQGAGPDDVVQIAGLRGELHWRPTRPGGTDLALTLRDVAVPLRFGHTDGRVIQRARLAAALEGTLPTSATSWPEALSDWRSHGGALRLDEASLDWNQSGAALAGSAAPDADGTLDGSFTLDLTHPGQALDTLRRGGLIGTGQATAILAVIGLVADAEPSPGPDPQIHLPLTLRHDLLALGRIPLLDLHPLAPPP